MPAKASKKDAKKDKKSSDSKADTEIYAEGTLEKRCEGNLFRKWQPRYCVFSSKGLVYFKSKDEHIAKKEGTFIPAAGLQRCSVTGLEILLQTTERALVFRAADEDECTEWSAQFLKSIMKAQSADFSTCGIGDPDTRFWAEKVETVKIGGVSQEVALCKVFKDTPEWNEISRLFSQTLASDNLQRVVRIQHKRLLENYRHFRSTLEDLLSQDLAASVSKRVTVKEVFHGATQVSNTVSILKNGFKQPGRGKGSGVLQYGSGCYFARDAELAGRYAAPVDLALASLLAQKPERLVGLRCIFLVKMLVGDAAVGRHDSPQAPKIPGSLMQRRFDTLTDTEENPSILVSTDDDQCYPAYVLCFNQ